MGRTKQTTPLRRAIYSEDRDDTTNGIAKGSAKGDVDAFTNGHVKTESPAAAITQGSFTELVICVGGIYMSFLSWAFLQERITTTSYGPSSASERFTFSIFLNTVQSSLAAIAGYIYLQVTAYRSNKPAPPVFPTRNIFYPLFLVAIVSSLASPFGYASLKHVDYITFILAKSCKLLPVMALHISVFRKRYPLYKYAVVALVTAGVAVFTLHQPTSSKKKGREGGSSLWGLFLLSINLLFDGLTNSTQDYIFGTFRPYTGQQMMVAQNTLSTALTVGWLFVSPSLAGSGLGSWLGLDLQAGQGEFGQAWAFLQRHPAVGWDVLGFAACGAFGQLFICEFASNACWHCFVTNAQS
ncbi:MAG: hypothetical protein Q9165_003112 [Trypethelium subeluteriae]